MLLGLINLFLSFLLTLTMCDIVKLHQHNSLKQDKELFDKTAHSVVKIY